MPQRHQPKIDKSDFLILPLEANRRSATLGPQAFQLSIYRIPPVLVCRSVDGGFKIGISGLKDAFTPIVDFDAPR